MLRVSESKLESLVQQTDEAREERMRAEAPLKRSEEEKESLQAELVGVKEREEEAKRAMFCIVLYCICSPC